MFDKLYSPKVLDHFHHPCNMGEMKNPDGVATVGNPVCGDVMRMYLKISKRKSQNAKLEEEYIKDVKFQTLGCLPADEEVVLSSGSWTNISSVDKGLSVLNSMGKKTEVVKTFRRDYQGPLLTFIPFVSPFNSFSVTLDHPILAVKRKWLKSARKSSSICDWLRFAKKDLFSTEPDYVKAKGLEIGDFLVFLVNSKVKDDQFFTRDLMRLLGFYLSEGYITAGSVINFSFNKKEKDFISEVKSLVAKVASKETSERTRGSVTEIRFCSKKWADLFYMMAKKLARKKTLSDKVLLLPFDKQREMIETYLAGDGDSYRRRDRDGKTYRAITTSRNLAIQIQEILARGGIFASIREIFKTDCVIEGRKLKDSVQYLISFKLERKHCFVRKHGKYFLVPIKKIEKSSFSGAVYNFQVAVEPNSYLVKGFAVHNCGAAIATSSMATEMIKGKSLKRALKLTNQAVAEALGGLPPVKMHCSVLAAEAVQKAIENYRKKKGERG